MKVQCCSLLSLCIIFSLLAGFNYSLAFLIQLCYFLQMKGWSCSCKNILSEILLQRVSHLPPPSPTYSSQLTYSWL